MADHAITPHRREHSRTLWRTLGILLAGTLAAWLPSLAFTERPCTGNHRCNLKWQKQQWMEVWKPRVEETVEDTEQETVEESPYVYEYSTDPYTVHLHRSNGSLWKNEPSSAVKSACLRETFIGGTASIEKNVFSQAGEDGILPAIFECLGHRDKWYLEIGQGECVHCSTRMLLARGWLGIVLESDRARRNLTTNVRLAPMAVANMSFVMKHYFVPSTFDHLSVVGSPNSWWLLHSVLQQGKRPRSIAAHVNRSLPHGEAIVAEYGAAPALNGTAHYGCSLHALRRLLEAFEYRIVAIDLCGIGVYAVLAAETEGGNGPLSFEEVLAAHRNSSQPCGGGSREILRGWRWVRLSAGLELTAPFDSTWNSQLQFITLAKEAPAPGGALFYWGFEWQDGHKNVSKRELIGRFEHTPVP